MQGLVYAPSHIIKFASFLCLSLYKNFTIVGGMLKYNQPHLTIYAIQCVTIKM
jgi:hypothetical protein